MVVISNDTTYPIYTYFLRFDLDTFSLVPDPKLVYELRFGPAVAAFLLLSAVAHLCLSTFGYRWYVKNLKKGRPIIVLLNDPPRTGVWPSFEWAHDTADSMATVPHWVVVSGLSPDGEFVIQDPRKGRLRISAKALMSEWEKQSRVSVLVGVRSNS